MNSADPQPIFVVGTGRSGSTVFFDIFAKHPNVAWLSGVSKSFPHRPWLNSILMRCRGHAVIDRLLGHRLGPSEAYPFWEFNCPGFSNPYRDLVADDVTPGAATKLRDSVRRITRGRRCRFLAKITGWPRIRYLREIFPHACFIEVTRNPCATASSLLNVSFWDGWRGPPIWRRGPLPPDLELIWRQEHESFVSLAAIEYVIVQRAMTASLMSLPEGQFHRVHYSDLCADAIGVFKAATRFSGLQWCRRFEKSIGQFQLVDRDDQWRKTLTVHQQLILERTLERARVLRAQ